KTLRSACTSAANEFLSEIKSQAPEGKYIKMVKTKKGQRVEHRPGFLKSRIKKRSFVNKAGGTGGRQSWRKGDVVKVRTGVWRTPYVGHVELGTVDMAGDPFLRRSASLRKDAVIAKVVSGLHSRIKRYEKSGA